jgi:hypothetical protein
MDRSLSENNQYQCRGLLVEFPDPFGFERRYRYRMEAKKKPWRTSTQSTWI